MLLVAQIEDASSSGLFLNLRFSEMPSSLNGPSVVSKRDAIVRFLPPPASRL